MASWLRAWSGIGLAAWALAGCGDSAPLPPAPSDAAARQREQQAFVEAMRPRRAGKPVIALLALNEGTETTDLMLPHAVLRRFGLADVQIVAPRRGRVLLYPAFETQAAQDLAGFDQANPSGADYVIVPAMVRDDDPAVLGWLSRQAARGAQVIGVCAGGLVVGQAGLLDGRRFASHWYFRDKLIERHPGATYVPHQRYLADRGVATTTGITASVPAMLALVEAIGGREPAQALAAEIGASNWSPAHDSAPFHLDAGRMATYLLNKAHFWGREYLTVDARGGAVDDIALALTADAWARTGRVGVEVAAVAPITLRSGLVLGARPGADRGPPLPLDPALKPMQQLDRTLCAIDERYGNSRREWVMLEMEYPGFALDCTR